MSKNKIALSFALAGILGATNAVAEMDGFFVGGQLGFGSSKATLQETYQRFDDKYQPTGSAFRYGILGGYKQFFTLEFGARYYAVLDYGTYDIEGLDVNTLNFNINADALLNFITQKDLDFGTFAGLSLGYSNHSFDISSDMEPSGFDLGINFGFRANVAKNHGIELYSRFGLLKQSKEGNGYDYDFGAYKMNFELQQPYSMGFRYTYSF